MKRLSSRCWRSPIACIVAADGNITELQTTALIACNTKFSHLRFSIISLAQYSLSVRLSSDCKHISSTGCIVAWLHGVFAISSCWLIVRHWSCWMMHCIHLVYVGSTTVRTSCLLTAFASRLIVIVADYRLESTVVDGRRWKIILGHIIQLTSFIRLFLLPFGSLCVMWMPPLICARMSIFVEGVTDYRLGGKLFMCDSRSK